MTKSGNQERSVFQAIPDSAIGLCSRLGWGLNAIKSLVSQYPPLPFSGRLNGKVKREQRQKPAGFFNPFKPGMCLLLTALSLAGAVSVANGEENTGSGGWVFSPIVFLPLEGSSSELGYVIGSALASQSGSTLVVAPGLGSFQSSTLSGSQIIGGFVTSAAFSNSGAGGGGAVAFGLGFGHGSAATIIVDGAYTATSAGSGLQSATANVASGGANSSANASANASSSLTGPAQLQQLAALSATSSASSTGAPSTVLSGFNGGGANRFSFASSLSGEGYNSSGLYQSPLELFTADPADISASLQITHAGFSLGSANANTPLMNALISSQTGSISSNFIIDGLNAAFSTNAMGASGFHFLASAGNNLNARFSSNAEGMLLQTSGDFSHGIYWAGTALNNNDTAFLFTGNDAQLSTTGASSSILTSVALSQSHNASQHLRFAGDNSTASSMGDNSPAFVLLTSGNLQSTNQFELSGNNNSITTTGDNSSAVALLSVGAGQNTNNIDISANSSLISTAGQNSAAIFSATFGGETATNQIELSGNNTILKTQADGSSGIATASAGRLSSTSEILLSGDGFTIRTTGENASAASMFGGGENVSQAMSITGSQASILTQGNRSAGVNIASLGEDNSQADLSITGQNATIATEGDFSPGSYLAASGSEQATTNLVLDGLGATISTSGNQSAGAVFAGKDASLKIGSNGGLIQTTGLQSHGVFFENHRSQMSISDKGEILACGPQSDGVFSQRLNSSTFIDNDGKIVGFRNGINVASELGLENSGVVTAKTGIGVAFDNGSIFNDGFITGPSGIVASQTNNGSVLINTPGAIISSTGPGGIAIDLQGAGDDHLIIGPKTSLAGTIDLGAGIDRLSGINGVSADLRVVSPVEIIDSQTGFVTVLDGGYRIIITDTNIYTLPNLQLVEEISDMADFNALFDDWSLNDEKANDLNEHHQPNMRGGCKGDLGFYGMLSDSERVGGDKFPDFSLSGNGIMGYYSRSDCYKYQLAAFGGIYNSNASTPGASADLQTFFGGIAGKAKLNNDVSLYGLVALGSTQGSAERRIVNNGKAAGFEYATTNTSSQFGIGKIGIEKMVEINGQNFTPHAELKLSYGGMAGFSESGAASSISVHSSPFYKASARAGIRGELFSQLLERNDRFDGSKITISADIGIEYSIAQSQVNWSVADQPLINSTTNLEEFGFAGSLGFTWEHPDNRLKFTSKLDIETNFSTFSRNAIKGYIEYNF